MKIIVSKIINLWIKQDQSIKKGPNKKKCSNKNKEIDQHYFTHYTDKKYSKFIKIISSVRIVIYLKCL